MLFHCVIETRRGEMNVKHGNYNFTDRLYCFHDDCSSRRKYERERRKPNAKCIKKKKVIVVMKILQTISIHKNKNTKKVEKRFSAIIFIQKKNQVH